MKLKQKIIYLAIAAITGVSYAKYTVIINPDKSSISFTKPEWMKTDPKFIGWVDPATNNEFYRYDCTKWSPAPETVDLGKTFTQTANDCKGKQFAQMINQEMNNITNELRNVGEPYIDSTNEKLLTGLANTKESIGTKGIYLSIINPTQGQSGIYQISDGNTGSFPAYVNMTDSGGNWILIARYTTPPNTLVAWNSFGVKGNKITTYTNSSSSYPVIPTNSINTSSQMMVKHSNATWTSLYGIWQTFSTFSTNAVIGSSGFPVNTSIGAKTMYIRANGWNQIEAQDMTSTVGLFNQYGNSGVCGGANVVGSNKMCITYTNDNNSHFDATSLKEFYIKASN